MSDSCIVGLAPNGLYHIEPFGAVIRLPLTRPFIAARRLGQVLLGWVRRAGSVALAMDSA